MQTYDVIVIGAGLMGCFAARHLAQRGYSVAVLEQENDVSMGISRANTAIVYSGYDMKPGTLKAHLTVEGNACFDTLCVDLGVAFSRTGSLMLAHGPRAKAVLEEKLRQGHKNGVPGLKLLDTAEVHALEPGVSTSVRAALFSPTTGTVNPWQLCLAAARDAALHGAEFFFERRVTGISSGSPGYVLSCSSDWSDSNTTNGSKDLRRTGNTDSSLDSGTPACSTGSIFGAFAVINCTGVEGDKTSELLAPIRFRLLLTGGSYLILDKEVSDAREPNRYPTHVIFSEPEEKGKGATFVPTLEGALMLGPSQEALDHVDREPGYVTEPVGLEFVCSHSLKVFPQLPLEKIIRSFGTLRPTIKWAQPLKGGGVALSAESIHDLYISWAQDNPGFLNIAGIKTPGLTCADGIGRHTADLVDEYFEQAHIQKNSLGSKRDFRHEPSYEIENLSRFYHLSPRWKHPLTDKGSARVTLSLFDDSEILCRCRQITAGEARAAIREELGARTVDGIKRRVGCGLGRCQGGFCMERVMLLLAEELQCDYSAIVKDRSGSWVVREPRTSDKNSSCPQQAHSQRSASSKRELTALKETAPLDSGLVPRDVSSPVNISGHLSGHLSEPASSVSLLVIGGGAAGLAAACAARDAGLPAEEMLLIDRLDALGGILPQCLHHGFGQREFGGTLSGPEYLAPLLDIFHRSGVPVLLNTTATALESDGGVTLAGPTAPHVLKAEALVYAAGCRERPLGSLPIAGARPSGVFTAGAAQRMVNLHSCNIGERIVVLGSGDVGMIMAGNLAERGKHVVALIEAADKIGGLRINQERYVDAYDIPLYFSSTVTRVFGHRRIEGVEFCASAGTGAERANAPVTRTLSCDTLIVSVGLLPENDLLENLLLACAGSSRTKREVAPATPQNISLPWLFLAGNARRVHSYIEGVVTDGTEAGAQAAAYLSKRD